MFKSLILDEFTQHELKKPQASSTKDEAFAVEAPKSKKQCSNCNKRSHLKADCWAKGGGKEGQGPRRGKDKDKSKDSTAVAEKKELDTWAVIEEVDTDDKDKAETVAAAGGSLAQPERVHSTATKLYDSRASRHMSPFCTHFLNYKSIKLQAISAANKQAFYAVGTGDLRIEVSNGKSSTPILLKDVFHAPDIGITVVSIDHITKAGYSVTFRASVCKIRRPSGTVIGRIPTTTNGLYKVRCTYAVLQSTLFFTSLIPLSIHSKAPSQTPTSPTAIAT